MFGLGLFLGLKKTDLFTIKVIEINGASSETEKRIRSKLNIKEGQSFWQLPLQAEINSIKSDPWIRAADVRREFPQKIIVNLIEREPVALLGNSEGKYKYLDNTNTIIDSKASLKAQPFC